MKCNLCLRVYFTCGLIALLFNFQATAKSVSSTGHVENLNMRYLEQNDESDNGLIKRQFPISSFKQIKTTEMLLRTLRKKISIRSISKVSKCRKCYKRNIQGKCRKMFVCKA